MMLKNFIKVVCPCSKVCPKPPQIPKSKLRQAVQAVKLSISSSEEELLIDRDQEVNVGQSQDEDLTLRCFLPAEVKTLGKLWARVKVPSKKVKNVEKKAENKDQEEPSVRTLFGLPDPTPTTDGDVAEIVDSSSDEAPSLSVPSSRATVDPGSLYGAKTQRANKS